MWRVKASPSPIPKKKATGTQIAKKVNLGYMREVRTHKESQLAT